MSIPFSSLAAAAQRSVALDFGHGLMGSANINTIGFRIGYAPSASSSSSDAKGCSNSKGTSTSTSSAPGARCTLADITQHCPQPMSMNLIVQDTITQSPTSPTEKPTLGYRLN
ncbi:hypothetical protein NLJ89_g12212 [Agrocybe chaxingu]|uniref:Uncharacterized protein n=1 Tax=Agrocybe chaxingu TaxID=84603 RepID=A0A9W8JMA4_9AGAR|nr:hypothetical protein NLJ89_g12212 [Agrocybe chaxingu]